MFDNADVNVQTLTGLGRWHALGSIACVPPSNKNSYEMVVVRCTEIRSFVQVGIFAQISIEAYKKSQVSVLKQCLFDPHWNT